MNTRRLLSALICIVMSLPLLAQGQYNYRPGSSSYADDHAIYYGLRLGLSLATVNSDDATLDGGSMQAGLVVGGIIGFQLSPVTPLFLESGLLYTEKGGKGYVDGKKFTFDLNYLEMPIVAKYKYELDDDLSVQPFIGGYLALGVGGKVKNYAERAARSSFSNDYFQRFDGGLRLGCGVEYEMMYAEVAFDLGLANINHDEFDSSKNRCLCFNIGVNF